MKTLVEIPQVCYIKLRDRELDVMTNLQRELLSCLNYGPLDLQQIVEYLNYSRSIILANLDLLKQQRLVGHDHARWYLEP